MKQIKKLGVLRDEIIWYTGYQSVKKYPGELRLVEFFDEENGKTYQEKIINYLNMVAIIDNDTIEIDPKNNGKNNQG